MCCVTLQVHPELRRPEESMFPSMESHFGDRETPSAGPSSKSVIPKEVLSRHRGWSESSVPPEVVGSTPQMAQVHPMDPVEAVASRPYSTRRDSSPLTMSHFGSTTPQRTQPQNAFTPQSRGSVPRASADRLQRLGDDLTQLARKLDSFDTASRVKY